MKRTLFLTAGFSLLSFIFLLKASAATFSKMYVFGDSLSDTGNEFNITTFAQQFVDPTTVIDPLSPPNFQGRDSNGPLWVDYLAEDLGLTLTPSSQLAVNSPLTITNNGFGVNFSYNGATTTQSVNFAIGGAETGFENATDPRLVGVLRQIQGFTDDLKVNNSSADPNALYVIFAGVNDYQSGGIVEVSEPVNNIATAVKSLFDKGARNFLVPSMPDLGKTPLAMSFGAEVSNNLSNLTSEHNSVLDQTLSDLSSSLTGINLISPDANSLFQNILDNPRDFGLTNVTESCLDGEYPNFSVCDRPNEYLFWDSIHPTTIPHERLGELARASLTHKSVPESSSLVSISVLGLTWLLHKRQYFRKSGKD
jgi:phospholipase/lecithinase/hemolysin